MVQQSNINRFMAKIDKSGPVAPVLETRCWVWTGAVDKAGYPRFWFGKNSLTAQRAAMTLSGVELDPVQQVVNICGNRLCVRREHLATATLSEVHALRHRGTPRVGPGGIALIRLVVRGDATVEFVAEAFCLSPGFVAQIVSAG